MNETLPPCGLYRTSVPLAGVPAGRLVYFHNHGEPGPGIYLPESWQHNRARFSERGHTLSDPSQAETLEPLAAEGLYRVTSSFACCDKNCRIFDEELLVQLGYDAEATPILFVPEWGERGLEFPERGTRLGPDRIEHLTLLQVADKAQRRSQLH